MIYHSPDYIPELPLDPPMEVLCDICLGYGTIEDELCPSCDGHGVISP